MVQEAEAEEELDLIMAVRPVVVLKAPTHHTVVEMDEWSLVATPSQEVQFTL